MMMTKEMEGKKERNRSLTAGSLTEEAQHIKVEEIQTLRFKFVLASCVQDQRVQCGSVTVIPRKTLSYVRFHLHLALSFRSIVLLAAKLKDIRQDRKHRKRQTTWKMRFVDCRKHWRRFSNSFFFFAGSFSSHVC